MQHSQTEGSTAERSSANKTAFPSVSVPTETWRYLSCNMVSISTETSVTFFGILRLCHKNGLHGSGDAITTSSSTLDGAQRKLRIVRKAGVQIVNKSLFIGSKISKCFCSYKLANTYKRVHVPAYYNAGRQQKLMNIDALKLWAPIATFPN